MDNSFTRVYIYYSFFTGTTKAWFGTIIPNKKIGIHVLSTLANNVDFTISSYYQTNFYVNTVMFMYQDVSQLLTLRNIYLFNLRDKNQSFFIIESVTNDSFASDRKRISLYWFNAIYYLNTYLRIISLKIEQNAYLLMIQVGKLCN